MSDRSVFVLDLQNIREKKRRQISALKEREEGSKCVRRQISALKERKEGSKCVTCSNPGEEKYVHQTDRTSRATSQHYVA